MRREGPGRPKPGTTGQPFARKGEPGAWCKINVKRLGEHVRTSQAGRLKREVTQHDQHIVNLRVGRGERAKREMRREYRSALSFGQRRDHILIDCAIYCARQAPIGDTGRRRHSSKVS